MKKIYIFKHDLPSLPHSFGSGTFALNSLTYNPFFEKIVNPPLNSLSSANNCGSRMLWVL